MLVPGISLSRMPNIELADAGQINTTLTSEKAR